VCVKERDWERICVNESVGAYLCMCERAREKERVCVCICVFVRVWLFLALCLFGQRARPKQGFFANLIGATLLISYVRVCVYMCACTYLFNDNHCHFVHTCMCACARVWVWVWVYVHVCVYTYTGVLASIETFELVFPLPSPEPLSSPAILENGEMSSWW